jgi:hypothetical protein
VKPLAFVLVVACSDPAPAAPAKAPPPPAKPSAAAALAKTFAKDVVGDITPIPVTADDYAMSLTLDFETFPTMEMRIDERRSGAWRMTLAKDNTVTACAGSRSNHVSDGQYHYEPDPAKRKHSSSEDLRLAALKGTWSIVDGVATIRLDHIGWGSCDLTKVVTTGQAFVEMRCIGMKAPAMVTGKRIACELIGTTSLTFDLAMPMTPESRKAGMAPFHSAPEGKQLVFGAPGVKIDVKQGSRDAVPAFTFTPAAVVLDEKAFQKPPKKP